MVLELRTEPYFVIVCKAAAAKSTVIEDDG